MEFEKMMLGHKSKRWCYRIVHRSFRRNATNILQLRRANCRWKKCRSWEFLTLI